MSELGREPGFYWVAVNAEGPAPERIVAHYDQRMNRWSIAEAPGHYQTSELTVLSERLMPPE